MIVECHFERCPAVIKPGRLQVGIPHGLKHGADAAAPVDIAVEVELTEQEALEAEILEGVFPHDPLVDSVDAAFVDAGGLTGRADELPREQVRHRPLFAC